MPITGINTASVAETTITVRKKPEDVSSDFSKTLNQAIEDQLVQQTIMSSYSPDSGTAGSSLMSQSGGITELIMSASASGEIGEAEMALMMLCSMMDSGSGSASSMLMPALAALFSSMKDAELVRERVMLENYSPETLDAIDQGVFGNTIEGGFTTPNVSESGQAIVPAEAWRPTTPAIVSDASDRSPEKLRQVIDQFNVETAERYRPYRRGNDTYCNIFVWDVTSALGCEIPHFVDKETGAARTYPDISGAYELDANGVHDWLVNNGASNGWREVSAEEAQRWANQGKPAVTAYKNSGGIGHVQIVCPSQDGSFDPVRGVTVAQAGSNRYSYSYISSTFGSSKLSSVRYFIHE